MASKYANTLSKVSAFRPHANAVLTVAIRVVCRSLLDVGHAADRGSQFIDTLPRTPRTVRHIESQHGSPPVNIARQGIIRDTCGFCYLLCLRKYPIRG